MMEEVVSRPATYMSMVVNDSRRSDVSRLSRVCYVQVVGENGKNGLRLGNAFKL